MKRLFLLVLATTLSASTLAAQSNEPVTSIYQQGRQAQLGGNNYRAIELYKAAIERNPSYAQPITGLAETYFALGEFSEALRYVQRAEKLDRMNMELVNLEGRIRIGLGELGEAKKLFERVLQSEPNNVQSKFGLAELSIAAGEPKSAAASFENALSIAPENKRALLSLVLLYDSLGELSRAERYAQMALQYHPDDAQVHYVAARHYLQAADYGEAQKQDETALSLRPGGVNETLLLSEIYLRTDQYDKVVPLIEGILSKNSGDYLLWYSLGLAYEKLGKVDNSIQSFARAFSVRPDDEVSRIALENELVTKTDIKDPRRARFAQYHFDQGTAYEQRNYTDRALREFRRGLKIDPYSMHGRVLYADVFNKEGYPAKYLSELNVLKKIGKTNTDITDQIEIETNLLQDSVSNTWGVQQFTLQREPYDVSVFYTTNGDMIHYLAQGVLAGYLKDLLVSYENISIDGEPAEAKSFADAFRTAREAGTDYFVILNFNESERYFRATADLYVSLTGTKIDSEQSYRTGNNRVTDALANVAQGLHGILPLRGRLLQRKFDSGLIDLGKIDGVKTGDKLLIVKNGTMTIARDRIGFDYTPDAVIGSFEVTKTDALVSEGTVTKNQFFDLINPEDWVIFPPPKNEQPNTTVPPPGELYRNFLKIPSD